MGEVVIFPGVQYSRVEMPDYTPQPQWRWFALKVAPGREFATERILRDDGFDVFVPIKHIEGRPSLTYAKLITGKTVVKKQRRAIARPKLNGYVFIGFDRFDIPWLDVMRFRMIVGVIADAGEPYAFREADIRHLVVNSSRPIRFINSPMGKQKKRKRPNAQVTSGPYQGRSVHVMDGHVRMIDGHNEVELFELFDPHLAKTQQV